MNILSLIKPPQIFANGNTGTQLTNPVIGVWGQPGGAESGELFASYAAILWRTAINVGGLLVIIFYIMATFEWLTSGGDSGKVEKARNKFVNATIGLILLVASFAIVAFVGEILFGGEFDILDLTFPSANGTNGGG